MQPCATNAKRKLPQCVCVCVSVSICVFVCVLPTESAGKLLPLLRSIGFSLTAAEKQLFPERNENCLGNRKQNQSTAIDNRQTAGIDAATGIS